LLAREFQESLAIIAAGLKDSQELGHAGKGHVCVAPRVRRITS
jgi:hypothetical protein